MATPQKLPPVTPSKTTPMKGASGKEKQKVHQATPMKVTAKVTPLKPVNSSQAAKGKTPLKKKTGTMTPVSKTTVGIADFQFSPPGNQCSSCSSGGREYLEKALFWSIRR